MDGRLHIRYRFVLPGNLVKEFDVVLEQATLGLVPAPRAHYPDWTRLTHHQCSHCTLTPETHPHCPVAASLVEVVEAFKDLRSCDEADVEILTEHRAFRKRTPLQEGLSALVGIYMVTSGCPFLDKLRPMVYTHAPFASLEETTYRALAMYGLAQCLRKRRGQEPDWEFGGLVKIYQDIGQVNSAFHLRILDVHVADAGLNALVRLDCYAQFTNRVLEKGLGSIERLFQPYLNGR